MVSLPDAGSRIVDRGFHDLRACPRKPRYAGRSAPASERSAVDDRLRGVFTLGPSDPLPKVSVASLQRYGDYLVPRLAFPFNANYCEEAEPLVFDGSVTATGLITSICTPLDVPHGLSCKTVFRGNPVILPLAILKLDPGHPNCQLIDDYCRWFWNNR